jgi:glycosyltransferase involved in cell wall biosynthesis
MPNQGMTIIIANQDLKRIFMKLSSKDISLIQPGRNNLKYLEWSYESIRENGGPDIEICVADDASTDGTWAWCNKMMKLDPNFRAIRNDSGERVGHTILYDRLINEVATRTIVGIFHADMYLCPGAIESILKYSKPGVVVSLTRIEPPLHPPGPEKILHDFGTEPETFDEDGLMCALATIEEDGTYADQPTTNGIFAPWFIHKTDFQAIGGHDPLFAPQSKEDSDIFNRFLLNGYEFIQTWSGFVYHMTCRGSRFNPTITRVGKESDEWLKQNQISSMNFIRKWGHFVKHDEFLRPIVPPKYDIGIIVHNCNELLLEVLEPWCTAIYVDIDPSDFIRRLQPDTSYDMNERVKQFQKGDKISIEHPVEIHVDSDRFTQIELDMIQEMPSILQEQCHGLGIYEAGYLKIRVKNELVNQTDKLICT